MVVESSCCKREKEVVVERCTGRGEKREREKICKLSAQIELYPFM